jgi:DNA-binding transcriptional MerR regulator
MAGAGKRGEARGKERYRMRDLCQKTGLSRQVIHFYIQQKLLPEGEKAGRNMAYYGEEHLSRLALIKRLQRDHLLPLKAIRDLLAGRDEAFSPAQRRQLAEVRRGLGALAPSGPRRAVEAGPILKRAGVDAEDLARMAELGLIALSGPERRPRVAAADAWLIELWGEARALGFTRARGFSPDLLALYDRAVAGLFAEETRLLSRLLGEAPPAEVAGMVERALPLIAALFAGLHEAKVKSFFAAL